MGQDCELHKVYDHVKGHHWILTPPKPYTGFVHFFRHEVHWNDVFELIQQGYVEDWLGSWILTEKGQDACKTCGNFNW